MEWIKRAWQGQERLSRVFWVYGVLLGIGIGLTGFAIRLVAGSTAYELFWIPRVIFTIWVLVAQSSINQGDMKGIDQNAIKAMMECGNELRDYQAKGGKDIVGFSKKCTDEQLHKSGGSAPASQMSPAVIPPIQPVQAEPIPAKSDILSDQDKYRQTCEKTMTDYAQKNGADPKQYVAQNQAYVQKCIAYYAAQNATGKKVP